LSSLTKVYEGFTHSLFVLYITKMAVVRATYAFLHLTFQEFFTAYHIARYLDRRREVSVAYSILA